MRELLRIPRVGQDFVSDINKSLDVLLLNLLPESKATKTNLFKLKAPSSVQRHQSLIDRLFNYKDSAASEVVDVLTRSAFSDNYDFNEILYDVAMIVAGKEEGTHQYDARYEKLTEKLAEMDLSHKNLKFVQQMVDILDRGNARLYDNRTKEYNDKVLDAKLVFEDTYDIFKIVNGHKKGTRHYSERYFQLAEKLDSIEDTSKINFDFLSKMHDVLNDKNEKLIKRRSQNYNEQVLDAQSFFEEAYNRFLERMNLSENSVDEITFSKNQSANERNQFVNGYPILNLTKNEIDKYEEK